MVHVLFLAPVAIYFAIVVAVTLTARTRSDDADYFFASRRLNWLQAFLSVISSETSVATTVVFPAAGLTGGYVLVWLLLGYITGRAIVAVFYLRRLYESSRLTIYQTISSSHRVLESAYLLAKYVSGGVRYFLGGFALSQVLGGPVALWILVVAVCVAAYSLTGGLRAVVVMDQVQSVLVVTMGIFLCVFLAQQIPEGALTPPPFVDWDPSHTTFLPILFLGGAVLSIGSHGADQDMLLRVLATKDFKAARRSLILSGFGAAFLISLYLTVGYLLRFTGIADLNTKSPLADYVTREDLPLLRGVFLVLVAAAAMSSLDSTIHSTGAIWKSLMNSQRVGRLWSGFSLIIMVGFALFFMSIEGRFPDFLSLCMGSMNYINGGLIGIVTVFTFFPGRLSGRGIVLALLAGFTTTSICEWAFAAPIPWTYTVLLSSSSAFIAAMAAPAKRIAPDRVQNAA